jgi:hypothetical protein
MLPSPGTWRRTAEQAPNKFVADPAGRVTAPALRRRLHHRFCALLDGLATFHLRHMPGLPRHRVAQLAMDAARAELTAATRAPSPSIASPPS